MVGPAVIRGKLVWTSGLRRPKRVSFFYSGGRKIHSVVRKSPVMQLYNLEQDIAETTNLYEKHPEVVDSLTALLEKYKSDGRSTPLR